MNAIDMKNSSLRKFAIWAVVIVVLALIVYLFTAAPGQYARATGTVTDGSEQFEVGADATVTPAAGWTVESKVDNIVGPFNSWSVLFSDTGTELRSPDRALTVDIFALPDEDPVEVAERRSNADVIVETLASGAEVRHIQTDARLVAVMEGVGSAAIVLEARAGGSEELTEYRPAISGILESLR